LTGGIRKGTKGEPPVAYFSQGYGALSPAVTHARSTEPDCSHFGFALPALSVAKLSPLSPSTSTGYSFTSGPCQFFSLTKFRVPLIFFLSSTDFLAYETIPEEIYLSG